MNEGLKNFFYPKSICVVGASSKEKSIGYEILKSIKTYSYTGSVFPVNPKSENILGYNCYKSILDIDKQIDLAIIVVPKKFVDESIEQLIHKEVDSVILITAGYKETGEEGKSSEENLLSILKSNNIRMIGPNCMGVINTLDSIKLNATFVAEQPLKGGIGFLSQSGALGAAVLNSLRDTDIRFAHFVSVGNKADVSELDIIDFWLNDENIKTITFYLESFDNGFELIKRYKNNKFNKPLIILKAGKTKSGMRAASSHTGALSSNEKITDALLDQFGIIRCDNLNEMFNTAKGFEHFSIPKGNRVAVITNAGGPAILAVDKLEEENLLLADFSEETKEKLKEIVHPQGSINNPVDLLPGGEPDTYKNVNEIILADKNVDAVVSIFVEPVMVDALKVIESVNSIKAEKPIYQVCMPLPEFWTKYSESSDYHTPIFRNPEDPAEIISNILFYESKKDRPIDASKHFNLSLANESASFLDHLEVDKICRRYNLPIVESKIINIEQPYTIYPSEFPIVVKGISKEVIHKSELSAVKLNIKNESELHLAIKEIKNSFADNGYILDQVLIQPYITTKHELLIGGFRDPSFGPVIMFGTGGKYVEVLGDTKIKSAYLNDSDVEEMISTTKIGQILRGVRGEESVDLDYLKRIIKSVSDMMIKNENILEIDLNPLTIDIENKFYAVDVRVKSNK
ncbi:MAG: acetate--CoA ligase family protein [Melioribacteraceae bacterium]|nr:acetate--CoA ligase family protein [Melioribacteraceae bacterium]